MNVDIPVYCGKEAISRLIGHCQSHRIDRFLLVSDSNTYAALGQKVEADLRKREWDVRTVILDGTDVIADEKHIFEVLFHAHAEARMYLAVGSGTITDVTRYASFCSRNGFISLPTAPSVDAYTSVGAALTMGGFKKTVPCQTPLAVFADLQTLCQAPRDMIAAGYGDVLGKYISLADWQLGHLLLDEPYDAGVAARLRRALLSCVENAEAIGRASRGGIAVLMEGLFESGLCMAEFGSSRPASGAEHIFSHFWEMKRAQEHRPAILHGIKVGLGTVLAARRYEAIRGLDQKEVVTRLSTASLPDREDEIAHIRTAYGPVADRIITDHRPFLENLEANFEALKRKIGDYWPEIQDIAATVPPPARIIQLLESQTLGVSENPKGLHAMGLDDRDVEQALQFSHYLRGRFTISTLGRVLGLW
jgi:glycerol-1-phosphate dehydrogenase [NAD(P)+]